MKELCSKLNIRGDSPVKWFLLERFWVIKKKNTNKKTEKRISQQQELYMYSGVQKSKGPFTPRTITFTFIYTYF